VSEETAQQLLADLPRVERDQTFAFACHPGISCFNACCADLDLLLSPYDVLRLRRALGVSSQRFMEGYARVERACDNGFPLVYVRMRDDARQSCPFVSEAGCTVYADRPGACRYYPIGRGAGLDERGELVEELVLVREPHCHGFAENHTRSVDGWIVDQGLGSYDAANDCTMRLISACHDRGLRLTREQLALAFLALYRLDEFGAFLRDKDWFARLPLSAGERDAILEEEEPRLAFAHEWLETVLLGRAELRGQPVS
jgi:Fe-S-cluster containining protein